MFCVTTVAIKVASKRFLLLMSKHVNYNLMTGGTQQRQFILDNIRDKSQINVDELGKPLPANNFVLRGKSVCDKAWCIAHGITYKRFLRCRKLFETGHHIVQHGNSERNFMQEKTTEAIAWMTNLFGRIGDWMPHKTLVHLPPTYTKKSLYERMVTEFMARGIEKTVSYEHFTSVWSDHLPQFIIAKRSEFTECAICKNLKEQRGRAATDSEVKHISELIAQHATTVEKERKEYQLAREKARSAPKDLTTIIIDGMDQAKTDVPHFIKRDKASAHLTRLPVHVTGVLIHTDVAEGKIPLVFLDNKDVPHDSNLTMNCLLKTLMEHKEKLGKSLFLQLDNCFRENKNRFLMAFAALLVESRIFEEVTMHFLPVGHTHEDVDQLFSRISAKISKTNIYTLQDLTAKIEESYKPFVTVKSALPLFDIKNWLKPHLYGEFRHHSHPHWFKFHMVDNKCRMHWKMWASSLWEPHADAAGRPRQ